MKNWMVWDPYNYDLWFDTREQAVEVTDLLIDGGDKAINDAVILQATHRVVDGKIVEVDA